VKGGDAFVTPFRLRYKRFVLQIPGEVILPLLAKLILLLSFWK
jgi:hypothetical protein